MGIAAFVQQVFIIVGFQEGRVALPKMMDQLFADDAQVGKNADPYGRGGDNETTGIGGIMGLGKGCDRQIAGGYRLAGIETPDELRLERMRDLLPGAVADIDGELIAPGQDLQTADMVVMFMRNKDRFYGGKGQTQPS